MKIGHVLLFVVVCISIVLFIAAKNCTSASQADSIRYASQFLAVLGTTFFSVSYILSGKLRRVEQAFGGMDKVFKLHSRLSIISFLCVLHHPLLLAVDVLPNTGAALRYILPSWQIAYTSGILSLAIIVILVAITLFVDLPYHLWKKSHSLMYGALFFASVHVLLIQSDTTRFFPLHAWLMGLLGLAVFVFFWNAIRVKFFQKAIRCTLVSMKQVDSIVYLTVSPNDHKMSFRPGQFVYLSYAGKRISQEDHPFSLVSSPNEDELRFGIRIVGDYTATLPRLEIGDTLVIDGPYGAFGESFLSSPADALCIAGGIGITPFMSLLSYARVSLPHKKIHLIYSVNQDDMVPFMDELTNLQSENISVSLHVSSRMGRLTMAKMQTIVPIHPKMQVLLCGPQSMMQSLSAQCLQLGIARKRIQFEDFSFL